MHNQDVDSIISNIDIKSNMTIETICKNIYELAYKVLEDSFIMIDTKIIEKVVTSIIEANHIVFFGTGASGISARYAYSRFFRTGINCLFENDITLAKMHISLLKKHDVIFAISSSGRTDSVVESAKLAKKNGVTVISLSDFAISPLSKISDLNLYTTPRSSGTIMNIDMPLLSGQITIIDLLYTCTYLRIGDKAIQSYELTKESSNAEKIK